MIRMRGWPGIGPLFFIWSFPEEVPVKEDRIGQRCSLNTEFT